jgi:predicted aminopeptidase
VRASWAFERAVETLFRGQTVRPLSFLSLLFGLVLAGCTGPRYVAQAACGQIEISFARRDLADVVSDANIPDRVRALLSRVPDIKRFGERHGLRPTASYDTYADLERSAAVWVVSASEPLRFKMKSWSFPIVGSVTYLGWFDRGDARDFARDLKDEGWDVDVRGASAYSTLGWFDDPVLSTMIPEGDEALGELANVVLHESVHATLYIKGQTALNESVANFIGDALAEIYLDETVGAGSIQKAAYMEGQRAGERRRAIMTAAYEELDRLYKSKASDREKLAEKGRILAALRAEIRARRPLTNATLAQFKQYNTGKEELTLLLNACKGSFVRLLASLRGLEKTVNTNTNTNTKGSGQQERDLAKLFLPLVRAGCPGAPS